MLPESTREKSAIFFRLLNWSIGQTYRQGAMFHVDVFDANGKSIDYRLYPVSINVLGQPCLDLYAPENMALAWRVLNWAANDDSLELYMGNVWGVDVVGAVVDLESLCGLPPAEAQAAWLDKVLCLCIEAGLVEVE
jgi:hypothetical protein